MPAATGLSCLINSIYDAGVDACRWPEVCARIAQRIGAAHVNLSLLAAEAPLPLERRDGIDASFVHSYRGTAMLVLVEPWSSRLGVETRLVALFGLTPAEARVACQVGKGRNPKDIADTLQIHASTVRTHLHRVFAKTAARRQAELMRLLAQLAIMRGG